MVEGRCTLLGDDDMNTSTIITRPYVHTVTMCPRPRQQVHHSIVLVPSMVPSGTCLMRSRYHCLGRFLVIFPKYIAGFVGNHEPSGTSQVWYPLSPWPLPMLVSSALVELAECGPCLARR